MIASGLNSWMSARPASPRRATIPLKPRSRALPSSVFAKLRVLLDDERRPGRPVGSRRGRPRPRPAGGAADRPWAVTPLRAAYLGQLTAELGSAPPRPGAAVGVSAEPGGQEEREGAPLARGCSATWISPPSRRAISRLIERPRPVPPCARSWSLSACWNASKIRFSLSSGIPRPGVRHRRRRGRVSAARAARGEARRRPDDADAQLDLPASVNLTRIREQVLQDLLQALLVGLERPPARPRSTLDPRTRAPSARASGRKERSA